MPTFTCTECGEGVESPLAAIYLPGREFPVDCPNGHQYVITSTFTPASEAPAEPAER